MSGTTFKEVAPAFAAKDFPALVAFYVDVLGFEKRFFTPVYAVLARDAVVLHIYPERDGMLGGNNSAYFIVDGVDALHDHLAAHSTARVVHPVKDQEYGLRDFLVEDPEGNKIGFAQRL